MLFTANGLHEFLNTRAPTALAPYPVRPGRRLSEPRAFFFPNRSHPRCVQPLAVLSACRPHPTSSAPISIPVTRIALCLACSAAAYWLITGSRLPVGRGFPDCISIRKENSVAAVGFLSFDGLSSLFVVKDDFKDWDRAWSEREDGHFCGFPVPPYESFAAQPTGLTFQWTLDGLAWTCPYWLMTTLWLTVFIRSQSTFRFRLTDLFLATAAVAITATLIRLHTALLLALPLNLATAALIAFFFVRSLQLYLRNVFTLWPGPTTAHDTVSAA